jgi:Glycogen debranching enzyme, glucanotransferase domain
VDSEFANQGLKVIALSDEPLDLVEPYVEQLDLNFTVASGSGSNGPYGVTGIPHSVLIDAEGNVAWVGNPYELSKGVIKKALKGAKHPKTDFMAVHLSAPVDARVIKAADLAADGSLSGSLKEIEGISADEKATDAQRKDATTLKDAIDKHVKALADQAEKLAKARDPEQAIKVLDALTKEFPSTEVGAKAKKRIDEINADPKMKAEIDASKALDRLKEQIRPLKRDKAKPKIEEFVKKYEGTRAAERAKFQLQTIKAKS